MPQVSVCLHLIDSHQNQPDQYSIVLIIENMDKKVRYIIKTKKQKTLECLRKVLNTTDQTHIDTHFVN